MNLVLASASERRHELLRRITEDFKIVVSSFDEDKVPFDGDCGTYVKTLSIGKALDVASSLNERSTVIGCDTVVFLDNSVLGKPTSLEDAKKMLQSLSGRTHSVYSGIALVDSLTGKILSDYVKSDVKFSTLTDEEIDDYLKTGEFTDKAGSYGIQGYGGVLVEEIHGCFYNIVGLPLNRLKKMLIQMGVNL